LSPKPARSCAEAAREEYSQEVIANQLLAPVSLDFQDTPLRHILEALEEMSGVTIVPDDSMEEGGVNLDRPVTIKVENVSLKSALALLLHSTHLSYVIKDEILQITTQEYARGKLRTVTYPVADLVVPIGSGSGSLLPAFCRQDAEVAANHKPGTTCEEALIKLIMQTIEPQSWADQGGKGTIQYFPLGLALVVNQTPDIQEQIQDLLAALRRLQDLEVAVEIRLVSVSQAFFERIGVDFEVNLNPAESAHAAEPETSIKESESACLSRLQGLSFLDEKQLYMFLEAAQGDRRTNILQAPKVTVFNGQKANVNITETHHFVTGLKMVREGDQVIVLPKNEAFETGFRFSVQPVISADRRFVLMNFQAKMTDLESAVVPIVPVTTHLSVKVDKKGQESVVPVQQFVQQPAFKTMTVDKSFQVADGKTAVLCWGTKLAEGRNEFGPPILSKIPYVNRLFRNVGYGRETQSLLLLITPRIIINEQEEQIFQGELPPIPR